MRYAGLLRPASISAFPEKPAAFYSKARLQFYTVRETVLCIVWNLQSIWGLPCRL
jgi:hypothetical protein